MKLVTISESHNSSDLLVLRSKLESEGIKCFMKDELTAQILTHLPSMVAELQVYESDVQKAHSIMKATGEYVSTEPEKIICPYCNSSNVSISRKPGNIIKFYFRYFTNQLMITKGKPLYKNLFFNCLTCKKSFVPD